MALTYEREGYSAHSNGIFYAVEKHQPHTPLEVFDGAKLRVVVCAAIAAPYGDGVTRSNPVSPMNFRDCKRFPNWHFRL